MPELGGTRRGRNEGITDPDAPPYVRTNSGPTWQDYSGPAPAQIDAVCPDCRSPRQRTRRGGCLHEWHGDA